MRTCLLLLALVGCSPTAIRRVNAAGAALTVAAMACDWGSTRQAAGDRWSGRHENGVPARAIMGSTPDVGTVDMYFAASTAAVLLLAEVIPERWRWVGYSVAIGAEAATAVGNMKTTRGTCGVAL